MHSPLKGVPLQTKPGYKGLINKIGIAVISASLLYGCGNDQDANESAKTGTYHTVRATSMYSQGDLGAAITEIQEALKKEPQHLPAIKLAGDVFLKAGDSETALSYFQQAIKNQPNDTELQLKTIEALVKVNQFHTALLQLDQLAESHPELTKEADFHMLRGYAKMGTNELVDAKSSLNQAMTITPKHARALVGLAKISFREGNLAKAESLTEEATKAHPFDLEVTLWGAQLSLLVEDYPAAENLFNQALLTLSKQDIMTSDRYYSLNGMVRALVAQGKTAEALKYSEMIEASPQGKLVADYNSALNSLKDGKLDDAEETFNTILAKIPGHANSETALGAIKLQKGDLTAAEDHLLTAVNSGKSVDRAHKLLALTQLRLDKPNDVIKLISEALKNNDNDPELLSLMGISYLKLDDLKEAKTYLERALKEEPKHTASRLAIANIYEQEKNHGKAITLYKDIIDENPELGTPYRSLLKAFMGKTGNANEAIAEFETFMIRHKEHLPPHLLLTLAYFEQGQFGKAHSVATKAKELFPDSKQVDGTLAALHFSHARSLLSQPKLNKGQIDKARHALSKAKEFAPNNLLIASGEIQLSIVENNFGAALEKAVELQNSHPHLPLGFTAAGRIHQLSGKPEEAVKSYEQAWATKPSSQIGITLFTLKRELGITGDALVSHLKEWQEKQPDDLQAPLALAMALQTVGANDDAILSYEKVLEKDPGNVLALNNLAWLRHEKGDKNAVSIAKRAYEAAPNNASIVDTYGWLLFKSDQHTLALDKLNKAHNLAPNHPEIMQHLIDALKANDQMDEATVIQAKMDALQKQSQG